MKVVNTLRNIARRMDQRALLTPNANSQLVQARRSHFSPSLLGSSTQPVIIVGAGVLGLSTATLLQKRYPQLAITIIAAETPSLPSKWDPSNKPSADFASMWAGAHYRPIPRSTRQLHDEAELAFKTAETMFSIAETNPEAGVQRMPAREYLENPPEGYSSLATGDLYAGPDDHFRVLNSNELPPGLKFGCEYQAYTVNVHVYCSWLLENFLQRGGKVVNRQLSSIETTFDQPEAEAVNIVVNCSGRNFDRDPKMQIIRGQTVLVRNEYHSTVTRQTADGGWVFLIPRPGGAGTVVGGTKEIGDDETKPRQETRQQILEAATQAFPDFVDEPSKFDVIMDNVGRRPWREGGLRLEIEQLPDARKVIHGYGAGGRGYELSWGVAEKLVDLYDQSCR